MQATLKKTLAIILTFSLILVFFFIRKWPDKYVHFVFCDVGQGDAVLIYQGFFQMVVDSGPDDRVLSCLRQHIPFWDRSIEVVVNTHYDKDHIGGFKYISDNYRVKLVVTPLTTMKDTVTFDRFLEALQVELGDGAWLKQPILGQIVGSYSGIFAQIITLRRGNDLFPTDFDQLWLNDSLQSDFKQVSPGSYSNNTNALNQVFTETQLSDGSTNFPKVKYSENDLSIGLLVQYNHLKVLLVGDLEQPGETALIRAGLITSANILKVGHHGAKSSSSPSFLRQVKPEFSVVSVGKNNQFGHPSPQTLREIEQIGSHIVRTDQLGTIEFVSDGQYYWLE